MSNRKAFLAFISALVIGIGHCQAQCQTQDCASCGESAQFGYPVAASHGGMIGRHHARHEARDAWKEESAKITARNDAWPKPFACHDKQAYHAVWAPMIDRGFAIECALCDDHFNPETNELNLPGQKKIGAIMQNLPSDRRQVLIPRHENEEISQARLANVNRTIQTFYGHSNPNTMVALTDIRAAMMSGVQADKAAKGYVEGSPAPIIPIATSGQGIASSTTQ